MKKMTVMCGVILATLNLCANPKPKADICLKVTDDLPRFGADIMYNGIFSVTNTGEVAFTVVTDKEWSGEVIRFYQEGNEAEQQNYEIAHGGLGKHWREQLRKESLDAFDICVEKNKAMKTLQPSESITFESSFIFKLPLGAPGGVYKAEMHLGDGTWGSVHITPTLRTLLAASFNKEGKAEDFYYTHGGTNQWLYVKTDDGKFKRVSEMKLGAKPQKEKEENAVTFELPDGTKKKLTREQARQLETKNWKLKTSL